MPAIRREDDKLERRFGDVWRAWSERTPAIIPLRWSKGRGPLVLGHWSIRRSFQNGEPRWLAFIMAGVLSIYVRFM